MERRLAMDFYPEYLPEQLRGHWDERPYFMDRLLLVGRNAGPALMFDWYAGLFGPRPTDDQLRDVLAEVWEMTEWPSQAMPRRAWIAFFRRAGFCSSPPGLPAPSEPLTVYRGCTAGRRRGMAWTTDLDQARWFARRWLHLDSSVPASEVVTMDVPPGLVLARCEGRGEGSEAEIVVDILGVPRGVIRRIEQHEQEVS
jgi:hypothetical protein